MNKTFCDRCGTEISKTVENSFKLIATGCRALPVIDSVDICPDCLRKLKSWLDHPSDFMYKLDGEWVFEKFVEDGDPES